MLYSSTPLNCKEIIERLKDILATDGVNKPKDIDVAKALKIDPNNLAQAKFKNSIPYKAVMDFLQSKQISINAFFYGANPQEIADVSQRYKVLKLYTANASAGGGCDNKYIAYKEVLLDAEILRFLGIKQCELIMSIGESMEGIIADHSLCLIAREENTIKNGKIYAINTLDGLFVKQCFICGESLELVSAHPAYANMHYPLNEVCVLGRIRGVIGRV